MQTRKSLNPFDEPLIESEKNPEAGFSAKIQVLEEEKVTVDAELQEHLIREKNSDIRRIQREMKEIGQIYENITLQVGDQEEMIDSIENNVNETNEQLVSAADEIQRTIVYQRRRTRINFVLIFIAVVLLITLCVVIYVLMDEKK